MPLPLIAIPIATLATAWGCGLESFFQGSARTKTPPVGPDSDWVDGRMILSQSFQGKTYIKVFSQGVFDDFETRGEQMDFCTWLSGLSKEYREEGHGQTGVIQVRACRFSPELFPGIPQNFMGGSIRTPEEMSKVLLGDVLFSMDWYGPLLLTGGKGGEQPVAHSVLAALLYPSASDRFGGCR